MKQWKRLAALSSAIVMAAATLTYFPSDTLQNIRWEISASADGTSAVTWTKTESDGLTWTLYADGTLTISGTGAMKDYSNFVWNENPVYNNLNVKKIVIEEGITSIGNYAFWNCSNLTSIAIPDSVTSIGIYAFLNCTSLTSITISDSVTSIGESAFKACKSLTSITIPDSVTNFGSCIFSGCKSLTSVTILEGVTSIGDGMFSGCESLTSITLPNSVTSIEDSAFLCCTNLTSITIPDSVTSIGGDAFARCTNLTSITIPDSVTSIGIAAFQHSGLTSITFPDSVTSIGYSAFWNCSNLTSVTISNSVTSIGKGMFESCKSLTSITIPDGVTSIGNYAFWSCSSLTNITIPDSVTSIGTDVFQKCSNLKTISLSCGSALKKSDFGEQANLVSYTNQHTLTKTAAKAPTCTEDGNKEYWTCEHCGKYFLSDDTDPETATAVEQSETIIPASHKLTKVKEEKAATCTEDGNKEYWTCEHCGKYFLSDDTDPETAKAVELSETILPALKHKNETIRGASKPDGTKPGYSGDRYCPDCDTVLEKGYTYWIEDNLTWKLYEDGTLTISGIGAMKDYNYDDNQSPVYKNSNVKKIVIEDGVTSIGDFAFSNCSGLTSITIPKSVTSIGAYAFSNCDGLTSITIPKSVTSIGDSAFASCISLTSVTLSSSVTSIGNRVFSNCSSLTSITIPDSVTSIGTSAFYNCSRLTSITIPDSVTSIGNYAFSNCSRLTSITIPDSVTSIGNSAFSDCSSLTSITIPDSVTSIGNYAFSDCSSLTSITIPDSVTSIGNYAFSNCSSLTSITIPDSVTSIGNSVFKNCSSLTSITIPDSVTSIGKFAFNNCTSLKTISLSCGSALKKSDFGEQADLVSYTNQHTLTKTAAKAPTCTEDGNKEYWTCEHCGKYFLSDDTDPETAKAVELSETILPALKHKNETIRGASKPDGTKPGYSGDRYCPDCDTVLEKGYTYWVEDNLTWKLYEDGTLNISGTGAMKDYSNLSSPIATDPGVRKVVIEDGVTSIGNFAFEGCDNLTSITIPDSVTSIGNEAFVACSGLTDITIPSSVTHMGDGVLGGCISLTSITIPDSVTSIGNEAFSSCINLVSITIPDGVTSIGNSAFGYCISLTSITIPDSVTSIGTEVFQECNSLQTISLSCKSSLKKSDFGNQANLVFYTNQHALIKTAAKAATCTEDGNKEYWTCEHCGKYFLSDDDTNPETAKAVEQSETIISASHKLTKVDAKAATCTEDGNIEYWQCDVCKKTFTDKDGKNAVDNVIIAALKHNYNENGFCENDDTHYQPANYNEEIEKYEISNAGQLYWFAEQVNSGNTSVNAVLTADIVVNENVLAADGSLGADPDHLRMWRPIGDTIENAFKGTFDGQGHSVSGLYFYDNSDESGVYGVGLFGVSDGIIQNVGLEDSYFNYYYAKIDGHLIVSGMAAGICAENEGQIINCYNAGTIVGYATSGICTINSNNGSIQNCYNAGLMICGFNMAGGICNINEGILRNCYNNSSNITVMTNSTLTDNLSAVGGICVRNEKAGRIENCYHTGQMTNDADHSNNICNFNEGKIENSYYDRMVCDKDAIGQNDSSAIAKNVEGKSTEQFTSGEVTYLLNGDQSALAFYQDLATEKYPTLNQKSKVVMQLEMIYDESFGEDATTNKTYHNAGDTIALETSPDKAYTYQYFVNGKQIEESTYTLTGNTKMTVKKVPVEIELSESVRDTIQLTYQKKTTLDLTAYLKNFADLKPMQFQLDADSKLPEGLTLTKNGVLSGTPEKAAETVKTTLILTAKNGTTKKMELTFHIAKADPTVEVTVSGDLHTEGDLVGELELILSENSTKGVVEIVSKIKALVAGKNTFTWKFTPEDENNYNTVTGTVVVNAQTTTTTTVTTTTTKATTTTSKTTATTKPNTTTTKTTVTTNKTTSATITTKTTTMSSVTTTNTATPFYGDVNLDGKVDILDAVYLNKYLATLVQFSDVQIENADCYQDGILNDQDTTALMQFIILLIDNLPV